MNEDINFLNQKKNEIRRSLQEAAIARADIQEAVI